MSDDNNINYETTGKTKPFHRKNKYENRNTCSKIMIEQTLKHMIIYLSLNCITFPFLKSINKHQKMQKIRNNSFGPKQSNTILRHSKIGKRECSKTVTTYKINYTLKIYIY